MGNGELLEKDEIIERIREMRGIGIPVRYIAGSLGISVMEVEEGISSRNFGESLSARLESKIELLIDSVDTDKVDGANLAQVASSLKILNDIKRLEDGKSTENVSIHVTIRDKIREQVKRHREASEQ